LANVAIKQFSVSGQGHTCAIRADNDKLYCWGPNPNGELGIGDNTGPIASCSTGSWTHACADVPQLVTGALSGFAIKQISAGWDHTCAIRADNNQLYCWGQGGSGELGNGSTIDIYTPTLVLDL